MKNKKLDGRRALERMAGIESDIRRWRVYSSGGVGGVVCLMAVVLVVRSLALALRYPCTEICLDVAKEQQRACKSARERVFACMWPWDGMIWHVPSRIDLPHTVEQVQHSE